MKFETFQILANPKMESCANVYGDVFDQIKVADEAGFECAWFAEHHFSNYGVCPNPLLATVKAAALTRRIRFGQAVLVTPLWHPLRLVEDLNLTDVLIDGRLNVGLGRGYQIAEFDAFGLSLDHSRQMFLESLEIMLKAWTEDDFTYSGTYYKYPSPMTVVPRPAQSPHPPLYIACTSPETLQWTARNGYTPLTSAHFVTNDGVKDLRATYDAALTESGRATKTAELHISRFVYVAETEEQVARAITFSRWPDRVGVRQKKGLSRPQRALNDANPYPGEPDDETWLTRLVFGTPERVIDQMKQFDAAGVTHVICYFSFGGMPQRDVLRSMELFAQRVMPALM